MHPVWKSNRTIESQLSQTGHLVDDPTADPDDVDGPFADVSDNQLVLGSTATVNPSDQSEPQGDQPPTVSYSQAARSEPPNSDDDEDNASQQYRFQLPSLSSRRLPVAAYSLMADRLNTSTGYSAGRTMPGMLLSEV